MGIAPSLQRYLNAHPVPFTLVEHCYAEGSYNTTKAAAIPAKNLVKAVLFRDEDFNYTLALVPGCNKVLRYTMNQIFDRYMELADEEECSRLFPDCLNGAIPPIGQAYGINVIWDDELLDSETLWLQAGDHRHLLQLKTAAFVELMKNALHEPISSNKPYHPPPKLLSQPYFGLGLY